MPFSLVPSPKQEQRHANTGHSGSRVLTFILWGLLIAILVFAGLSACSRQTPVRTPVNLLTEHSGNFDATANITYKELRATATIVQETPRACSVTFSSPASLKDMSFVFREGVVDMAYKGLAFTFDPQSLPGGAAAKIAVAGINRAMKDDGITVDYTEGILSLSGIMESGEFSLRLDPESGNLMKLSVPAEELEIEFINFTFLD